MCVRGIQTEYGVFNVNGAGGLVSFVPSNNNVRRIVTPPEVISICDRAFANRNLNEITLSDEVISISSAAFCGLNFDCWIKVDRENPQFMASSGNLYRKNGDDLVLLWAMRSVLNPPISNRTISIGDYAFYCGCCGSIEIPPSVTTIGKNAFSRCEGLCLVTLSEGLKSIGDGAFSKCTGLNEIVIPASVTDIGFDAFAGCSNLESVRFIDSDNWDYVNRDGIHSRLAPQDLNVEHNQTTNLYFLNGNGILKKSSI